MTAACITFVNTGVCQTTSVAGSDPVTDCKYCLYWDHTRTCAKTSTAKFDLVCSADRSMPVLDGPGQTPAVSNTNKLASWASDDSRKHLGRGAGRCQLATHVHTCLPLLLPLSTDLRPYSGAAVLLQTCTASGCASARPPTTPMCPSPSATGAARVCRVGSC